MSASGVLSALQKKNEQEFVEVTRRIQDALARIERDQKLKATQEVLAKLSNCSRGTLNNRKWPIDQLRAIKAARKTPIHELVSEGASEAKKEARIERYKQQLYDSREEVLLWKSRYDDVVRQVSQVNELNRVLTTRLAESEEEIARLKLAQTGRVVEITSRRPR